MENTNLNHILIIINTIDAGGAETFIMKVFRCLASKGFVFDFLINKKNSNFYYNEIKKLGGNVFYGYSKSKHPIKSFNFIKNTVKNNGYKSVLVVAVHPIGFLDLLASKKGGAINRIIRSTNSKSGGFISYLLAALSRPLVRRFSTKMIAPSIEAGLWLFGKKGLKKMIIVKNGIDISLFEYNEEKRIIIRNELGIRNDEFVLGHIGRFNKQKNHVKLISIFCKLQEVFGHSKLVLVGEGETKNDIKKIVKSNNLDEKVLFIDTRSDVADLLMGLDVLVFPSLYEGMPNIVIESQATGLPCVISKNISKDVKIVDPLSFVSIDDNDEKWVKEILSFYNYKRLNMIDRIVEAGYDIQSVADSISSLFVK